MPFLIRRINRAKWGQINIELSDDASADAITNCLKTFNNDLSVWKIENEGDLDNAILALITGNNQTKLSTLHYVIIDESIIINSGLELKESEGDTVVPDLIGTHKDISKLTYSKLGIVKNIIIESLRNERSSFYTRKQLKEIIENAIQNGRLDKEKLNPEFILKEKFGTIS